MIMDVEAATLCSSMPQASPVGPAPMTMASKADPSQFAFNLGGDGGQRSGEAEASFPPPSAMSGRPPPLPPTACASCTDEFARLYF